MRVLGAGTVEVAGAAEAGMAGAEVVGAEVVGANRLDALPSPVVAEMVAPTEGVEVAVVLLPKEKDEAEAVVPEPPADVLGALEIGVDVAGLFPLS